MSEDLINNLYEKLYLIRCVEETIAERYHEGKMRCPTHLSTGQEAVSAAFSLVAKKDDFAVSTHRGHAHYLAKGGCLDSMIAEIYGKITGCSKGKGGSMHLIDLNVNFMGTSAIVGNSIPVGVGLALSTQIQDQDSISFIFLGDGSIEEGVFYESANFAAIRNLPTLFICENNLYSVYSGLEVRQPKKRSIAHMVSSIGIESFNCDGNDSLKCYNILKDQTESIRQGSGPKFIEFSTYRWREHCGPEFDNNLGYRKEEEFLYWKDHDPLVQLQELINDKNIIDKINNKIEEKVKSAFDFADSSPFPNSKDAYKGIYAD